MNQEQNKGIYRLSIFMIVTGFGMLLSAFALSLLSQIGIINKIEESSMVYLFSSGIVTQFIAGTVLIIYKSISRQTNFYFESLNKSNNISASLKITESITDNALKEKTKTEIAKIISSHDNLIKDDSHT